VKDLAEKSNIPTPKLAIVPDKTPNAFVFGRTTKGATLAVHEGLLRQLTQEEIQGVLGHELGHIKHKDFLVMTILSALPVLAYLIARMTFRVAMATDGGNRKKKGGELAFRVLLLVAAVVSYIVYIITLLCVMRLSRLREHYADAYSAYVTGAPRQLQSALTKITYGLSLSPEPPHGARTLYIGDPALAKQECKGLMQRKKEYDLDKDGVLDERELELAMEREAKSRWTTINTWFTTHPATFQRILLLREIEKEMSSGRYGTKRIYAHI
jgi:heat shock protein HtpX